jgi:kumamolisin
MPTRKTAAKTAGARKRVVAKKPRVLAKDKSKAIPRTHVLVPGSERPVAKLATRVRDLAPDERVEVTLTLKGPALPGADEFPAKSLTLQELEANYGASEEDVAKVVAVLEKFGLSVPQTSLATRSLRVVGTAKQMEKAFRPGLGIYKDAAGREYRDREGSYAIPKSLENTVTAVIGFGQRAVARRRAAAAPKVAAALQPLAPKDIESIYQFPGGSAEGQVVGIAEFGGGYFAEDLAAYCQKFSRPIPPVNAIAVNRPAYTLEQILALPAAQRKEELDSSVEVMMDVEVIAGLCPAATLNVYFATFDQKGWVDLLNKAIEDKPVALSVSWGLAEDDPEWSRAARNAINDRLNAAALLGITVCVAAGDDGSGDEETDGRAHVDFPASSPFVLGVGGTMISGAATPGSEVVWWESPGRRTQTGGGATGGGVSVVNPRPAWQTPRIKSINQGGIDGRVVPDVAAVAGDPFYDLVVLGKDAPNGGTSASAPVWAALVARLNANLPQSKQQRFLTPLFYKIAPDGNPVGAVGCNDITQGNNASHPQPNKGYKAGAGFDAVSGWGTPRGKVLQAMLSAI